MADTTSYCYNGSMSDTISSSASPLQKDLPAIRAALLAWFATAGRDLPWRRTRDPYQIMVSEIMLQQTQVDRVVPKYQAFLQLFPTLEALAAAPTAEVIRAWAGLGYNRRAVNMQRAALVVQERYDGRFPQDLAELLKLPGIGPYTAGAIACFAFEQDVGFMDTNIRRVIQRLFVGPEEAGMAGEAALLDLAQATVPPQQGWAWNQAVMELGALVCTAAAPACWRCPVGAFCRAYADRRAADQQVFQGDAAAPAPRPRRLAERREAPFTGSNRFYRGRVIEALRNLPPGAALGLHQLGQQIKSDWSADDLAWIETLLAGLERDGLLVREGAAARLP
jgi:A/G-specific adenine glycosylase